MDNPKEDFLDKASRWIRNKVIDVYGGLLNTIDFYKTARAFGENPVDALYIAVYNNPRNAVMRQIISDTAYERNAISKIRQETIVAPHDTEEKWEAFKENLKTYKSMEEAGSNLPTFYSLFDLVISVVKNICYRWKKYKERDKEEREDEEAYLNSVLTNYKDKWEVLKNAPLSAFVVRESPKRRTKPNRKDGIVETRPDIGEIYAELGKIRDRLHSDEEIAAYAGRILTDEERETVRKIREYALTIGHAGLMEEVEKLGAEYTQEEIFEGIKNHILDTRGFEKGLGPNGVYKISPEWDILSPEERRELWNILSPEEQTLHVDLYKKRLRAEKKDFPNDIHMLDGGDLGTDFGVSSLANLYNRLFGDHVDENLWRLEENLEQAVLNRNLTLVYSNATRFKEMTGLEPEDNEEFERLFEEARNFSTIDFINYFDLDVENSALVRTGNPLYRYAPLFWPLIAEASGDEKKAVNNLKKFFDIICMEIERIAGTIYRYKTTVITNILKAQNVEEARQFNRRSKAKILFELGRLGAADMLDDRVGKFYIDNYYFALDQLTREDGILEKVYNFDVNDEFLSEGFQILSDFNVIMNKLRACRNTRFMREKALEKDTIKALYQYVFDLGVRLLSHYVQESSDEVFTSEQCLADYIYALEICKSMAVTLNDQTFQKARQDLIKLEINRMQRAEQFEDLSI